MIGVRQCRRYSSQSEVVCISRELFDIESLNFTPTFILVVSITTPNMTSLSYFRSEVINVPKKRPKMTPQTASGGISREMFKQGSPKFHRNIHAKKTAYDAISYFLSAFIDVREKKQPKMPPPTALGWILVMRRFACSTNWLFNNTSRSQVIYINGAWNLGTVFTKAIEMKPVQGSYLVNVKTLGVHFLYHVMLRIMKIVDQPLCRCC